MACILKNVISANSGCIENPAGLSNYCMVVPLDSDHITTIGVNDAKNQYVIKPASSETGLKGFRIEFKGQTGQVTSEDNGGGKGWTVTGTGRVEKNTDDMAYVSRILSNMDGKYLVFFPTGNIATEGQEWLVVGNPFGDSEFTVTSDTGAARGDDHGQTFNVVNSYQLYPEVKWYGTITKEVDPSSSELVVDTTDNITIEN